MVAKDGRRTHPRLMSPIYDSPTEAWHWLFSKGVRMRDAVVLRAGDGWAGYVLLRKLSKAEMVEIAVGLYDERPLD